MLFWLSDIFLRIGTGQPPTVVKNLLPTSSCISVRLQIGDIYKLEILSFLSKALSLYVSGDFFFKPFHLKIKFINSKKATKFYEIPTLDLSYVVTVKSTVEISQNFVAFSEYMNFNEIKNTYNNELKNSGNGCCVIETNDIYKNAGTHT